MLLEALFWCLWAPIWWLCGVILWFKRRKAQKRWAR